MINHLSQLAQARTDKDHWFYENKCCALDCRIDAFTYQLYHLNPEIRKKSLSPETPRKKARDD